MVAIGIPGHTHHGTGFTRPGCSDATTDSNAGSGQTRADAIACAGGEFGPDMLRKVQFVVAVQLLPGLGARFKREGHMGRIACGGTGRLPGWRLLICVGYVGAQKPRAVSFLPEVSGPGLDRQPVEIVHRERFEGVSGLHVNSELFGIWQRPDGRWPSPAGRVLSGAFPR